MKQQLVKIEEVIELVKQTKHFVFNQEMAGHVTVKGAADYVTQVDFAIQNFLKEKLYELAPEIQFLGEESGLLEMPGESFWILDPIDGTTNLIHGYLHSVVSLALCHKGEVVMGVIYDPYREEVFSAEKGRGSFLNGQPVHVSGAEHLDETIIGIGTSPYQKWFAKDNFVRFQRVFEAAQDIRRTGSAAMELAYIACGRQGGYFEICLQPWDYAAGVVLVQEAGGIVTDFEGNPLKPGKASSVIASNGRIHEELQDVCFF